MHYYDLRKPSTALFKLSGYQPAMLTRSHRKAVSYAKFLSGNRIVTASTDNSLRAWDLDTGRVTRVFTGHLNEKNFVGLVPF